MGVRRTALAFEKDFARIPNEWLRDKRLTRKARGLLAEIMTHSVGWHVSVRGLEKTGPEGRDAIRAALVELKDAGYLQVSQARGDRGRWSEVEYELCDPATADGKSVRGESTGDGLSGDGPSVSGQSDHKKTISIEDHQVEASSEAADAPLRADIDRLLDLLDELIIANGGKAPSRSKKNVDAARLLLTRDGKTAEQVSAAIRWSQGDEFWRSNILSMSKLREKYDTLRLQAQRASSARLSPVDMGRAAAELLAVENHPHLRALS